MEIDEATNQLTEMAKDLTEMEKDLDVKLNLVSDCAKDNSFLERWLSRYYALVCWFEALVCSLLLAIVYKVLTLVYYFLLFRQGKAADFPAVWGFETPEQQYLKGYRIYVREKEKELWDLVTKINEHNTNNSVKDEIIQALKQTIKKNY